MDSVFNDKFNMFILGFPEHRSMVLSTSLNDDVTSRMMSIIKIGSKFYFQTDRNSRKACQIRANEKVSLCSDNTQIDGLCKCVGAVKENSVFCHLFSKHCRNAYNLYSYMENEFLYEITPTRIQRWLYENNQPFVEVMDCVNCLYEKKAYLNNVQITEDISL